MSFKKVMLVITITAIALSFTACRKKTPTVLKKISYRPLDLTGKTEEYRRGAGDGCDTAVSKYTKDHDAFNTNIEYYNGWFAGRRNCEEKPRVLEE